MYLSWKPDQPGDNCRHTLRRRREDDVDFLSRAVDKRFQDQREAAYLQRSRRAPARRDYLAAGRGFATILHTDADLNIGELAAPKEEYAVYIDLDKGNWKLIVNKQVLDVRRGRPLWGIANRKGDTTNDPATELGRAALT